jgi:hypothetical protein
MGLELKIKSKQNLSKYRVLVEDSSVNSDEYFSIVEFPEYLGEGKNLLRIKTNPNVFQPNSQIFIEVLDPNGTPVYWEIPDHREKDDSRLISIWVYGDRNDKYDNGKGIGEVILLGTLATTSDGKQVPDDFKKVPNVRWRRKVSFAPDKPSNGKIVFKAIDLPRLILSSSVDTFTNKVVSNNQLVKTITNSDVYYKKSTFGNTTSLEYANGDVFEGQMVGGVVYGNLSTTLFPRLGGGQSQPTTFTASISSVVSNGILTITNPLTQSDNRTTDSIHTYEYSDGLVNVNIEYYTTSSDTQTQNQVAVANITLNNLNPIVGRVHSVNTLLKSQGLSSAEYQLISNNLVEATSSVSFKVPIPTEHLNDPKTLKLQFLNVNGVKSETEIVKQDVVFTGGNVYIAGDQSLITGSFHIGNSIGTGIEMAGHSSGYLKSVGYQGMTSASLGKGPGGFLIWSGSGNLQVGVDDYPGVGMEMVSAGGSSSFFFTTAGGGNLKVITDDFFIGTENTQFISGSNGNIEISSSFFHLNPKDDEAVVGGFVITPTAISSSQFETSASVSVPKLALKANGQITGSDILVQRVIENTFYTLLDTHAGIIDARNNGRQLVSYYDGISVVGIDTSTYVSSSDTIFPIHLLPGENRLLLAFSILGSCGSATSVSHGAKISILTAFTGSSSPATNSGSFDNWQNLTDLYTTPSMPSSTLNPFRSFVVSPNLTAGQITIPSTYQGRYCLIKLSATCNVLTGTADSNTSTLVRGFSLVATRTFAGKYSDGSATIGDIPELPE